MFRKDTNAWHGYCECDAPTSLTKGHISNKNSIVWQKGLSIKHVNMLKGEYCTCTGNSISLSDPGRDGSCGKPEAQTTN